MKKTFLGFFKPAQIMVKKTEREIITDNAVMYYRCKDRLKDLQPDTLQELYNYINTAYNALPHAVTVASMEIDCEKMERLFIETNEIWVSSLHNESPIFPGKLNLKFRAIHDYIHMSKDYGCDYAGEYKTYLEQSKGLTLEAKKVLYSEIVLQACYFLHYGNFPAQKIVLLDVPNEND